ncbi:MAG: GxxExxY protein [Candidatus Paceibacterales bacterium]
MFPELTYQIIGILFSVWNNLSYGHKERFYQRAIAQSLREYNFPFKEQVEVKVNFKGKEVDVCYLDFLIDNKIVLEIKKREYFSTKDIEQLYAYLKATGLKLGILAHFTRTGVKFKRIVNLK